MLPTRRPHAYSDEKKQTESFSRELLATAEMEKAEQITEDS